MDIFLLLLTQLQRDTKGNIMDIFLLEPACLGGGKIINIHVSMQWLIYESGEISHFCKSWLIMFINTTR